MSDLDQNDNDEQSLPVVSELDSLKSRADLMGVKYHPSIGVEKLKAKIHAKLNDQPDPDDVAAAVEAKAESSGAMPLAKMPAPVVVAETPGQRRMRLKREATKLVRINIICQNPGKKEWEGEIFATGNGAVGTVKKFVPFNTTEGYHVPQIILNMIRARECQIFVSGKTKHGVTMRRAKIIKEFLVEVLDPLTSDELKDLAQRQAMAAGGTV